MSSCGHGVNVYMVLTRNIRHGSYSPYSYSAMHTNMRFGIYLGLEYIKERSPRTAEVGHARPAESEPPIGASLGSV